MNNFYNNPYGPNYMGPTYGANNRKDYIAFYFFPRSKNIHLYEREVNNYDKI